MTLATKGLEQFYHVHPYIREIDEAITDLERAAVASGVNRDDAFEWARKHFQMTDLSYGEALRECAERLKHGVALGLPGASPIQIDWTLCRSGVMR